MKKVGEVIYRRDCRHPEHRAPQMISLLPGIYEHRCPSCGGVEWIEVHRWHTL